MVDCDESKRESVRYREERGCHGVCSSLHSGLPRTYAPEMHNSGWCVERGGNACFGREKETEKGRERKTERELTIFIGCIKKRLIVEYCAK